MNSVEETIQLVTRRLRPDAELQMEVAHELRAHLEDAVADARADGASGDEAQRLALERFGDPKELSDKLWQANRRRMRLRAVARWAFRAAALPAALLVTLLLAWHGLGFMQYLGNVGEGLPTQLKQLAAKLRAPVLPYRTDLTPDETVVLAVIRDEPKQAGFDLPSRPMAQAEQLVSCFPDNPLFQANRASVFLSAEVEQGAKLSITQETLERGLAIMDAGECFEPDNAFYNYMKASLLMDLSGAAETKTDPTWQAESPGPQGVNRTSGELAVVYRPELFERGLAEYRKGLAKSHYCSYVTEMAAFKASLRQKPALVEDALQGMYDVQGNMLPDVTLLRRLNRLVLGQANALARAGKLEEAADLLATASVPGTQQAIGARFLIALMSGHESRARSLRLGATLYERMGMAGRAAAAQAAADAEEPVWREAIYSPFRERRGLEVQTRGGFMGMFLPSPLPRASELEGLLSDMRNTERFGLERAALGLAAAMFLVALLWCLAWTGVGLVRHRRDPLRPRAVFIGWRRLGDIMVVAVILPLTAYYLFTRSPFGSADYGINWAADRVALELCVTIVSMLTLAVLAGRIAVRSACAEKSISLPERRYTAWRVAVAALLAGAWLLLAFLQYIRQPDGGSSSRAIALVVALPILATVLFAVQDVGRRGAEWHTCYGVERRSMAPVWVACLLLLALVAFGPLKTAERRQAGEMYSRVTHLLTDEVNSTSAADYQRYLQGLKGKGGL